MCTRCIPDEMEGDLEPGAEGAGAMPPVAPPPGAAPTA